MYILVFACLVLVFADAYTADAYTACQERDSHFHLTSLLRKDSDSLGSDVA